MASYNITCNFLHNMHRVMLFAQPCSQSKQAARLYALFKIWPTTDVFLVFIFSVQTLNLFIYSVAWLGEASNMCDTYLFLVFYGPPRVFSFIYELLINNLDFFFKSSLKYSSKQDIQYGKETFCMWTLHATIICQTSYTLSRKEGGGGGLQWTREQSRYFQNYFQTYNVWHKLSTQWKFV